MAEEQGTAVANGAAPAPAEIKLDTGIPDKGFADTAIENDPEYKAMLEEEAAEKAKKGKEQTDKKEPGEEPADKIENNEGKDKKDEGAPADDKTSSEEDDLGRVEFADDVIPGLKGEFLKTLPKEALAAIADFYEGAKGNSEKISKAESDLNELLKDPIVKNRREMLSKGKSKYDIRGLTQKDKQGIISVLQSKLDLTSSEAEIAYSVLEPGLNQVASEMAEDMVHNRFVEEDQKRQTAEITTKGRQVFLGLGKFNKDLAFKETNPDAFWQKEKDDKGNESWVLNERHPEIDKYKKNILPIQSALAESGMNYSALIKLAEKFGDEAVYALAASKLKLPSAINTGDRDKKMVASELRKKLAPFLKGASGGELNAERQNSLANRSKGNVITKQGYDIVKLAEGGDYYDKAIADKPGDTKHAKMIAALSEEGAELQAKLEKRKQ
jgi:predicted transcriptional regulator